MSEATQQLFAQVERLSERIADRQRAARDLKLAAPDRLAAQLDLDALIRARAQLLPEPGSATDDPTIPLRALQDFDALHFVDRFCRDLNKKPMTLSSSALEEMQAKALPLKGAERQKAYEDIAKYIYDQFYTVPIGHPNYYYGLSNKVDWKPRLDAFIMVKEMKLK